jgi:hypothetical protein
MNLYEWLGQPGGIIGPAIGDAGYYAQAGVGASEYINIVNTAINNLAYASDPNARRELILRLHQAGGFPGEDLNTILNYWADPGRPINELRDMANIVGSRLAQQGPAAPQLPGTPPTQPGGIMDPGTGVTDVPPVRVGNSTVPAGGRVVVVDAPLGSDQAQLYFIVYPWRGLEFAFQVGGEARFNELFGGLGNFASVTRTSQAEYDATGYIPAGLIDSELGATESFGSRLERETRELGLEDLPSWLAGSPDALALVATATAEEWSSGRLWEALSGTQAFQGRFGTAWSRYFTEGRTIQEAVNALVADENALRAALQPWLNTASDADTTNYLQGLLNSGWTPQAVVSVLETGESLRRDPQSLALANTILTRSGLPTLDEVGFVNALRGVGPQDTIEALNTATAARAMVAAGIDLPDDDINLIMDLVNTSDRLLTEDSWRQLSQELSFNLIRFNRELDQDKLNIERDEIISAAFGQASPTGRSSGEVMSLLARFERDRRAASEGIPGSTGFIDDEGRLRLQGVANL